jgi:hypothetical protein
MGYTVFSQLGHLLIGSMMCFHVSLRETVVKPTQAPCATGKNVRYMRNIKAAMNLRSLLLGAEFSHL